MRYFLSVILMALCVVGCQVVDVDPFAQAPAATEMPRNSYGAELKDGHLSWWVDSKNEGDKRCYFLMVMSVRTVKGWTLQVDAGWTVDAGKTLRVQSSGKIDGMEAGDALDLATMNCMLMPGAGCETPTTHIRGNWPAQEVQANYTRKIPQVVKAVMVQNVQPQLEVSYDETEARTFGCRVWLDNLGPTDVVCDMSILMDGKVRETTTIGAAAYSKSKVIEKTIVENVRAPHEFKIRIDRSTVVQIGKSSTQGK